jgi:hypothetical protein
MSVAPRTLGSLPIWDDIALATNTSRQRSAVSRISLNIEGARGETL